MNANGSNGAAPQATINVTANLVQAQTTKLVFNTSTGQYIGTVSWECAGGPDALTLMANQFQAWAAQQSGGIQIAGSQALGGLQKAS